MRIMVVEIGIKMLLRVTCRNRFIRKTGFRTLRTGGRPRLRLPQPKPQLEGLLN